MCTNYPNSGNVNNSCKFEFNEVGVGYLWRTSTVDSRKPYWDNLETVKKTIDHILHRV